MTIIELDSKHVMRMAWHFQHEKPRITVYIHGNTPPKEDLYTVMWDMPDMRTRSITMTRKQAGDLLRALQEALAKRED